MTLEEILSQNSINHPELPNGTAYGTKSLYENCIKYSEPQDPTEFNAYIKATIKWHEYLERYVNDEDAIIICRLYEAVTTKDANNKKKSDTRRGLLTKTTVNGKDFQYAFSSNFFPRAIFTLAYNGIYPNSYEELKDMFVNKKFSLRYPNGFCKIENKAAFQKFKYANSFYTEGWYLAHIVSVNAEPYISYNINPNEFIEPGNSDDWKYTMSDNTIYRQTPPLTEEQAKVLRAHCLRFLDPLNYFLTPTSKKFLCTYSKNIGEHPSLTKYMKVRNAIRYGNIYEEFLKSCDAVPLEEFDYKAFLDHEEPLITFGTNEKTKSRVTNKNKSIQRKGNSSTNNSQLSQENASMIYAFLFSGLGLKKIELEVLKKDHHGNSAKHVLNKNGINTANDSNLKGKYLNLTIDEAIANEQQNSNGLIKILSELKNIFPDR